MAPQSHAYSRRLFVHLVLMKTKEKKKKKTPQFNISLIPKGKHRDLEKIKTMAVVFFLPPSSILSPTPRFKVLAPVPRAQLAQPALVLPSSSNQGIAVF